MQRNISPNISADIDSGKTTLTKMLAKHYDWKPLFEPVDYNPYLEDFYQDKTSYAQKQILIIQPKLKGETCYDRCGKMSY